VSLAILPDLAAAGLNAVRRRHPAVGRGPGDVEVLETETTFWLRGRFGSVRLEETVD
jgi:hypothetical protein